MKLIVLAPSAQYLASAGNRIRYQRLREPLAKSGCTLAIASVGQTGKELEVARGDVVLFSKVQDARSVGLARDLRANGIHVGVDLFDDYFSQTADARFAPQRLWLEAMAGSISFFLCSTKRMQAVAQGTLRDVPGFVLNDPFERFEVAQLAQTIKARRVAALESGVLDVLWFGMGDNPSFPIGLHDLTQYGYLLGDLERQGFAVNLTVLTNLRALDARGLALLRQLPVEAKVEEWSHGRESELLGSSLISFVPVNAQPFSIAKSLNRAVTALTAGTQVLTAGYPLYDVLGPFFYTDPAGLAEDVRSGELRVSAPNLAALGEKLNEISNPVSEARALQAFLAALPAADTEADLRPLAILHGERTNAGIHSFARQNGWLSLGSPYTPAGAAFDAHLAVFEAGAAPAVRLTSAAAARLSASAVAPVQISDKPVGLAFEIALDRMHPQLVPLIASAAKATSPSAQAAMRSRVDAAVQTIYQDMFGPLRIIESEFNPFLNQAAELGRSVSRMAIG